MILLRIENCDQGGLARYLCPTYLVSMAELLNPAAEWIQSVTIFSACSHGHGGW